MPGSALLRRSDDIFRPCGPDWFGPSGRVADVSGVGRTNATLLAMGLLCMLALSLLMNYFLRAQKDLERDPVLNELTERYGARLDGRTELQILTNENDRRRVATLEVRPIVGASLQHLATQLGEHVWRRLGDRERLDAVVVRCIDLAGGKPRRFEIAKPYVSPAKSGSSPPPGK